MTNKDFLSQFSDENKKPDSFKEEERVKITKEKKPLNVKLLVIILLVVLVITGLVLFFILRPTIEVKNFVGLDQSEVKAWIKQNEIETQGIIFREEYNFDYDEGYIISQSIESGKKVKKNTKMDFVVSMGADPDELVRVPDLSSMYKEEIQEWIKENKLTKTKVMSQYNDEVEDGQVISIEFKNCDEYTFTRSSTLNISVSKGPQPAGTVVVEDFVKQDYSVVEAWGKKNKVEINKSERYDDNIAKDLVISQSIDAKKEIKEGETLTVVVSLGKAVYAKDFLNKKYDEVVSWAAKNGVTLIKEETYSNDYYEGNVMSQSIASGNIVKDELKVVVSKGNPKLDKSLNEMTYEELKIWISEVNEYGANIKRNSHIETNSDTVPVGNVIDVNGSSSLTYITTGSTITINKSIGRNILIKKENWAWSAIKDKTETEIRAMLDANDPSITYRFEYKEGIEDVGNLIDSWIEKSRDGIIKNDADAEIDDMYISQADVFVFVICNGE